MTTQTDVERVDRRPVKLIATMMALIAMVFSSFVAFPEEAEAAGNKNNPNQVNELLNYLNDFRVKKGLPKVKINTNISNVSLNWSAKMADTGNFYHNPNYTKDSRIDQRWRSAGEIIAMNSGSVKGLHNQWVNSPPHNSIMSNPAYNVVGIGLATNSKGQLYGTINFYRYDVSIPGTYEKFPGNSTPKQTFTDVPQSLIFYNEIETLAKRGISKGWTMNNGTKQYRPMEEVKRDAMIVFIYRAMGSPSYTPPKKSPFSDVSTSNVFYKEIAWAHSQGIADGWKMKNGTRQFRPLEPVKRDAVAAFLMRASGDKAPVVRSAPFKDVSKNTIFAAEIQWMKDNGISKGWPDGTYQPLSNTKRDAMAAFVVRWDNKY